MQLRVLFVKTLTYEVGQAKVLRLSQSEVLTDLVVGLLDACLDFHLYVQLLLVAIEQHDSNDAPAVGCHTGRRRHVGAHGAGVPHGGTRGRCCCPRPQPTLLLNSVLINLQRINTNISIKYQKVLPNIYTIKNCNLQ